MKRTGHSMLKSSLLALAVAGALMAGGGAGCEITVTGTGTLVVTNDIVYEGLAYDIDALYVGRTEADALSNERLHGSYLGFGESWTLLFADTGSWVIIARDTDGYYYRTATVTVYDDLTSEVFVTDYDYSASLTDELNGGTGGTTTTPTPTTGSLKVINLVDFQDGGDYTLSAIYTADANLYNWTEQLGSVTTVGWNEAAVVASMPPGDYDVAAYDVNGNWYTAYGISVYEGLETELTLTLDSVDAGFSL